MWKNSESDFLATVENFKENLKFPLAFGGECTADFWVNFSVEKMRQKSSEKLNLWAIVEMWCFFRFFTRREISIKIQNKWAKNLKIETSEGLLVSILCWKLIKMSNFTKI